MRAAEPSPPQPPTGRPPNEQPAGGVLVLSEHWRRLVDGWAARRGLRTAMRGTVLSVEFDIPDTGRVGTMRFMTTSRLLVGFMTDGRILNSDELAIAAAASNAWNTEQMVPMLSVWDVRGTRPCLAGSCTVPLACRITQPDFDVLADDWMRRARSMFARCAQVFKL